MGSYKDARAAVPPDFSFQAAANHNLESKLVPEDLNQLMGLLGATDGGRVSRFEDLVGRIDEATLRDLTVRLYGTVLAQNEEAATLMEEATQPPQPPPLPLSARQRATMRPSSQASRAQLTPRGAQLPRAKGPSSPVKPAAPRPPVQAVDATAAGHKGLEWHERNSKPKGYAVTVVELSTLSPMPTDAPVPVSYPPSPVPISYPPSIGERYANGYIPVSPRTASSSMGNPLGMIAGATTPRAGSMSPPPTDRNEWRKTIENTAVWGNLVPSNCLVFEDGQKEHICDSLYRRGKELKLKKRVLQEMKRMSDELEIRQCPMKPDVPLARHPESDPSRPDQYCNIFQRLAVCDVEQRRNARTVIDTYLKDKGSLTFEDALASGPIIDNSRYGNEMRLRKLSKTAHDVQKPVFQPAVTYREDEWEDGTLSPRDTLLPGSDASATGPRTPRSREDGCWRLFQQAKEQQELSRLRAQREVDVMKQRRVRDFRPDLRRAFADLPQIHRMRSAPLLRYTPATSREVTPPPVIVAVSEGANRGS